MANILTRQSGNFNTNTTWEPVEAGTGAQQVTKTNSTNITTSYQWSSAFTVTNNHVIDGVLLYVKRNNTIGTVTVAISADGGSTVAASVTVNATDISSSNGQPSFVFFKFTSPITGNGGSNYKIGIISNSSGNISGYYDSTVANWTRLLRVTSTDGGSTQAVVSPGAGDNTFIHGELTSVSSVNFLTVTMDNADAGATIFGTIDVGSAGTLSYGTALSTAYYLKLGGSVNIWDGGEFDMGVDLARIPATSSAVLEFNCSSPVQYGLVINKGGIFKAHGQQPAFPSTLLNADFTANGTTLTTADSTGWKNGDKIAVASTTQTYTDSESTNLTADASGTTLTVGASTLTRNHSGSPSTQAEVLNLTRNVKIRSVSSTNTAWIFADTTSTVDIESTEISNMGSSTGNQRGIDILTTTGNFNFMYNAVYNFPTASSTALNISGSATNNITISHCSVFNVGTPIAIAATSNSSILVDHNIFMLTSNQSPLNDVGFIFTNNTFISSSTAAFLLSETNIITGTISGNTCHSCAGSGFYFDNITGGTISSITAWRNGSNAGLRCGSSISGRILIDGVVVYGNSGRNIIVQSSPSLIELRFNNVVSNAGSTLTAPIGIEISLGGSLNRLVIDNSSIGVTTHHTTGDIDISQASSRLELVLRSVNLGSTNKIVGTSNLLTGSKIGVEQSLQVSGVNYSQIAYGNNVVGRYDYDATIYDVAPSSLRMTPASSVYKFESSRFRAAIASGQTLTISAKIRQSNTTVGDAQTYNGNFPRLVLAANSALGILQDTVLATGTITGQGVFEAVSASIPSPASEAGVLEFYIDCDGTQGWINVDSLSVT